ncbi:uncharacterized protein LOC106011389 [Aplysia californica]|uniref:Uncharacterized protein LOC106011389 n=1 Tax=Aplysia californica TaxID=6500 RepID=A0ABM0ZX24_APLCA|nr:uncharacterized protein LOC106011389 [Aplysia californica]
MRDPVRKVVTLGLLFVTLYVASSSQTEEEASTVAEEELMDLLKATEYHYENMKRNMEDMDKILTVYPMQRLVRLKNGRISKRSEVSQLFTSFMAFCENLRNENNTVNAKPTTTNKTHKIPQTSHTRKPSKAYWYSLESNVKPVKLKLRRSKTHVTVVVTVKHSVPCFVMPFLSLFQSPKPLMRKLRIGPKDSVPKVSRARFLLEAKVCLDSVSSASSRVHFQVGEMERKFAPSATIGIDICKGMEERDPMSATSTVASEFIEEEIRILQFNWTLQNNTLISGNGQNSSFEVDLTPTKYIGFAVDTMGYTSTADTISKSFWDVTGEKNANGSYDLQAEKIEQFGNSNMTFVEVMKSTVSHNTSQKNTRGEQPATSTARVHLTVDTASGTDTGVLYLSQDFLNDREDSEAIIQSSRLWFPLHVRKNEETPSIPYGKFAFFNRTRFLCNTNPAAEDQLWAPCALDCQVSGVDIATLKIYKANKQMVSEDENMEVQSQVSPNGAWAKATMHFEEKDQSLDGDYICEARSERGITDRIVLNMIVAGYPDISDGAFTMSVIDDKFASVKCAATGTNLNMSIYKNERTPGNRIDFNITKNRPSQNELIYTVLLPLNELRYYTTTLECVAANNAGEDVSFIYPSEVLNQLRSTPTTDHTF